MHNEFYKKIENNALTIQELSDDFDNIMPLEIKNEYGLNLIYVVALLLHFYNNNQDHQNRIQLYEGETEGNKTTPIKIKGNNDSNELAGLFSRIDQQLNHRDTSLKYLINKINLTESVIIN